MPELIAVVAFLEASVRLGIPLALAAMGETITERSGVINIGLEGSLIAGALGGALGALAIGDAGGGILVFLLHFPTCFPFQLNTPSPLIKKFDR